MTKKLLKGASLLILGILALLISLPFLFADKIEALVKEEINKSFSAKIDYESFSFSLIKDFPNLRVNLEEISVAGIEGFAQDTLASITDVYVSVDLWKAMRSNTLDVKSVRISDASLLFLSNKEGQNNWDILVADSTQQQPSEAETAQNSSSMNFNFDQMELTEVKLRYHDQASDLIFDTFIEVVNLNGNFQDTKAHLLSSGKLTQLSFSSGGDTYINKLPLTFDLEVEGDMEKQHFTLKDNAFSSNELHFSLEGDVGMAEDRMSLNLNLQSKDADIRSLLSLIPPAYRTDLEGVSTKGIVSLTAQVNGDYYENHYPAFELKCKVNNGRLKYNDLKESIEDIFLDILVSNKGGDLDLTIVDLKESKLRIANNPFAATFSLKQPMSNPHIKGEVKGTINFEALQNALPLEEIAMKGLLKADVSFDGTMDALEKERYEQFKLAGNADLSQFHFQSKDFEQGILIQTAKMKFEPRHIELLSFDSKIGQSDIQLKGKLTNYFQYLFKGADLSGNFVMNSKYLNLNEFMSDEEPAKESPSEASGEEIELGTLNVPENLNLSLQSSMQTVVYDNLDIKDVTGLIRVNDSKAYLSKLNMNLLEGAMGVSGTYSTKGEKSSIDFNMDVKELDIEESYQKIDLIKEMMPIAATATGKLSSSLNLSANIGSEMSPVRETMNGKGSLTLKDILVKDNKLMNTLSELLGNEELGRLSISNLKIDYLIKDGNVEVSPFTTSLAGNSTQVAGKYSANGALDFTMLMQIPREKLGGKINSKLASLPGIDRLKVLDIGLNIGGTTENPVVTPDLKNISNQLLTAAKDEALGQLTDKIFGKNPTGDSTQTVSDSTKGTNQKIPGLNISKDSTLNKVINEGLQNLFKKKEK